jgi:hypothetical protein
MNSDNLKLIGLTTYLRQAPKVQRLQKLSLDMLSTIRSHEGGKYQRHGKLFAECMQLMASIVCQTSRAADVDEGDVGDKIDLVLTEQKPPQKSQ